MIKHNINVVIEKLTGYKIRREEPKRKATLEAIKLFKNKKIIACEIGVFEGKHALNMLKNLNIKKLYLIDPYIRYEEYKDKGRPLKPEKSKTKAHKLLKKYLDRIVWIEKLSDEALGDIKEELDFLYIDGNHRHPYVDNDINNYYAKVRNGGIISGHDYCSALPDVIESVNNFSKEIGQPIIFANDDWIFFKKESTQSINKASLGGKDGV